MRSPSNLVTGATLAVAFLLGACHPEKSSKATIPSTTISGVVKVELTNERPRCWMPEQWERPKKPEWPTMDEDYYRRMYVHRLDYEKLFDYAMALAERQYAIVECLRNLTEMNH